MQAITGNKKKKENSTRIEEKEGKKKNVLWLGETMKKLKKGGKAPPSKPHNSITDTKKAELGRGACRQR